MNTPYKNLGNYIVDANGDAVALVKHNSDVQPIIKACNAHFNLKNLLSTIIAAYYEDRLNVEFIHHIEQQSHDLR